MVERGCMRVGTRMRVMCMLAELGLGFGRGEM